MFNMSCKGIVKLYFINFQHLFLDQNEIYFCYSFYDMRLKSCAHAVALCGINNIFNANELL